MELALVGGAVFAVIVFGLIEHMDAILDALLSPEDPLDGIDES